MFLFIVIKMIRENITKILNVLACLLLQQILLLATLESGKDGSSVLLRLI